MGVTDQNKEPAFVLRQNRFLVSLLNAGLLNETRKIKFVIVN
jgi:hypothetical protein